LIGVLPITRRVLPITSQVILGRKTAIGRRKSVIGYMPIAIVAYSSLISSSVGAVIVLIGKFEDRKADLPEA
jgi:hypothetical protein